MPTLISPGKYSMSLDNLVGVQGIDRLYITPSASVKQVELLIMGTVIAITHPRISDVARLDGKVTFWKNWYLSNANTMNVFIDITMEDPDTVPIIHYRQKETGSKLRWSKAVFMKYQNWTPRALEGTPYNNILVYSMGTMTIKYSR